MPNFVHQCFLGSLFLLGRAKGHTKIVCITGISICLFVTPLVSSPYQKMLGGNWILWLSWDGFESGKKWFVGESFSLPQSCNKIQGFACLFETPFKRVLCCASVVLQLADRKSSSFGSGGARLLVELLVSWIGWRVISLDWVCVFGQACLLWVTSFVWFFVNKDVCFEVANSVCVCVCVRANWELAEVDPFFRGLEFSSRRELLVKGPKKAPWKFEAMIWMSFSTCRNLCLIELWEFYLSCMLFQNWCVWVVSDLKAQKSCELFWEGFCRIFFWEFAVLRKKVWEREVCS